MKTLYERLVEVMKPEDISNYRSDLFVKATDVSKRIIDEYYSENKHLSRDLFVSKFVSNIPPCGLWYEIAFAYDPFWEGENNE